MASSELYIHQEQDLNWLKSRFPGTEDSESIQRAYDFAALAHKDQFRKSGAPYVTHCLAVACIIADMGMDCASVVAGLLHDVVEDTPITLDVIEKEFGYDVALMVDGVTKLSKLECRSKVERQAESFRKMFIAMAKDIRVIMIKLADRLHNMRTLQSHCKEKQVEIAKETLEIYAPLAHRLGIFNLKNELEDLCLYYLMPDRYTFIADSLANLRSEREHYITRVIGIMKDRLGKEGIDAEIKGRPKHIYSIHRKMINQEKTIEEIYDLVAIRIIVKSIQDCYAALGIIHTIWKPIPGRFKDFVAMPKENMYQSIHTTVMGLDGEPFEIQIRTEEMHRVAEYGIAAHWVYKEGTKKSYDRYFEWLRQSLEWQSQINDTEEYIELLKLDMFEDIVFAFTPKGDVLELPMGATPLDFAYRVHSEIGHRCIGSKVNGRIVPLEYTLKNGDIVEILTSKASTGPKRDWLNIVRTSQARSRIRAWFNKENRADNLLKGREMLDQEMKKIGLDLVEVSKGDGLLDLAKRFGYNQAEDLFVSIGDHSSHLQTILQRIKEQYMPSTDEQEEEKVLAKVQASSQALKQRKKELPYGKASNGVVVRGVDNVLIRLSHCCNPLPGDDIVGYITRGRGVSVHRKDCPNMQHHLTEEEGRLVDVKWAAEASGSFTVELEIRSKDRSRLTSDILTALADMKLLIHAIHSRALRDGSALTNVKVEIRNAEHLTHVMEKIKKIKDINGVYRVTPGKEKIDE